MNTRRNRLRSLLNARNFTLAMVMVNATGLVLVQQKMSGAKVDDAFALDAGVEPISFARAELPDRIVLPEIELSADSRPVAELAEAAALPPLQLELDLADIAPEPDPLPVYQAARERRNAFAIAAPAARTAEPIDVEPEVKLTRIERIPVPSTAKAAPAAKPPVLVETLPSPALQSGVPLAPQQSGLDSFSAAFGDGLEAQMAPVQSAPLAETATAPTSVELDAIAPVTQAPVFDLPPAGEPEGTVKLPAPTAYEMPQSKPIVPFAKLTNLLPASA